jgi:acetyl-CoA synthetase
MPDNRRGIDNLFNDSRRFEPPAEFVARANVIADWHEIADMDPGRFWAGAARRLAWSREWDQVVDWSNPPFARWFVNGQLNVAVNCVDRHVESGHGAQVAFYWEGEPGDARVLTYAELRARVCQAANALVELGVRASDRVAIYLPMIPETVIAMLACARLGAPHTVVSTGFAASALAERVNDFGARVLITADGRYWRGQRRPLKPAVDQALRECPSVRHLMVVRRTGQTADWHTGRDVWWHDLVEVASSEHRAQSFDAEHPLYVSYTSGETGKPKGVLHTSGGYLTQCAYTHKVVFDIKPNSDVYWCPEDIGGAAGHSYVVYGPLANRTTSFLYEGTPNTPHRGRWWEMIDRYRISILYTVPAMIRTFVEWGSDIPGGYDLSSLRLLGTVGEPIDPETWMWYREHIGRERCPIVDTWWQTETGAIMISPLPAVTATKPGSAMRPLPGISVAVVDGRGRRVRNGQRGNLVVDQPWPAMLRGVWDDEDRFRSTHWSRYGEQGFYFAGESAKYDSDGDLWLLGRTNGVTAPQRE